MERYTLDELEAMPTLSQGHTCNLKVDDGQTRVWLFRGCVGDFFPATEDESDYPLVTVEELTSGRWETTLEYVAEER